MASLSKEVLLNRVFSDSKNYPYGFSRSGDFSIAESRALSEYGCLIAALVDGEIAPRDEEDFHFLNAAKGDCAPQSAAERAWLKYQKRINRPKAGSIYGTRKNSVTDDAEGEMAMDIDEDFD
ncbi:DUF413 domain-containing protein [Ningiella sp. W23]|uniref:DUF413 domain-containing protein n=1 Tax=Ningiella sp. W23 TaxID=3023715 RepID=UPI00375784A6